jgi:hypothetical protein
MKTLEQMTELEKRTLASWIRRRMQGRVNPTMLAERTDQDLCSNVFKTSKTRRSRWYLRKTAHTMLHESTEVKFFRFNFLSIIEESKPAFAHSGHRLLLPS